MNAKTIGLFSGAAVLLLFLFLPIPEGMKPEAMFAAGVALLMAIWWITEAMPIYATAFVPLVAFPLLGVLPSEKVAENYGHNYVLMLIGGLIIAKAIEKQNLHKRIALMTVRFIGTDRRRIILSFMLATAFLSMWLANVAVTLMMLPIALSVVHEEEAHGSADNFGLVMMLGLAYAASIGGMATLIGTPPNLVFTGIIHKLYPAAPEISFTDWLAFGVPLAVILLPAGWLYLIKYFSVKGQLEGGAEIVQDELRSLGRMSAGERRVLYVFLLTSLGWIFRKDLHFGSFTVPGWSSLLGIEEYVHDATVAIFGMLLLFIFKGDERNENGKPKALMSWKDAEQAPWGVVMIVGGGYALAESFSHTGLAAWIGSEVTFLQSLPTFWILLVVVTAITFITEINSNTATANIFMPILATMAIANQAHPYLLMIPATFACSCAFMLPSGTGTNAVVFASNKVTIPQMARAGFMMNFIAIAIITLVAYFIIVPYFNLETLPGWLE